MGEPSSMRPRPTKLPSGLLAVMGSGFTSVTVGVGVNLLESLTGKSVGWDILSEMLARAAGRAGRGRRGPMDEGGGGGGGESSVDSAVNLWILSSSSRARALMAADRAVNLASSKEDASM